MVRIQQMMRSMSIRTSSFPFHNFHLPQAPMKMEPLEETDPPRRVDPNGGNSNCHARPDEEPQSFLENLDMSEFGGFDFDFSCLQETSQSIDAFTLDGQGMRKMLLVP